MTTDANHAKPGQFTAMISSTALDLEKHRPAVEAACIGAGVFPIWMKHLPARDASGVKVSLEMVDQADLYIGVYAWRYGWVPKGGDKSITELEFDHAVKRQADGKLHELLIFTAHDDHPFTKKDIEADATAQAKLAAFKTRACDGRVKNDFSSVEELQRLVSEALREFMARQSHSDIRDSAFDIPHTAIPHNLPALQSFFGREDELRKIAEALEPGTRTWGALIDGPGGMGKTSLAVRAAHDCTPVQFERIAFVSLKSRELDDDGVRDLSGFLISGINELFNELAERLGHRDIAKEPEDKRPRLLLSALEGSKTLLILDNLESLTKAQRDTVFTFVKRLPAGCKAILTARGRIGSGAEELILEKLSQDAALATLAKLAEGNAALAKTSEAERIVLYMQTGGKPLLLRWTAGQIGRGSCLTFTDAIAHLRSCPEGNDPLEFIFGDLVADFSESETRALCALTYFTLPAKLEHIRSTMNPFVEPPERQAARDALFKTLNKTAPTKPKATVSERVFSEAEVDKALRSLVNRSLVVPSEEFQTFAMVPLVADFLREKRPEIVTQTGERLDKHVYALVVENGYQKHDRFPMLEAAWPCIAAALPRFLRGENERLQTLCDALFRFLDFTGRWDEWLALERDAEGRAVAAGDFSSAGWRAQRTGSIHDLRGQSSEVLASAHRAEAHWIKAEAGVRERAIAISLRGSGYQLAEDYPAAITAFREVVEIQRNLGRESEDLAIGLNTLAGAERLSGKLDDAERDYREALRIAKAVDYSEGIAYVTGNLAALALDRNDWAGAKVLAREALPLSENVGRQELIAADCQRLAAALVGQGKKTEAQPYAQRAAEIYQKLRSPDLAAAQETLAECEE